jgi:hypothetical protein
VLRKSGAHHCQSAPREKKKVIQQQWQADFGLWTLDFGL